MLILSSGVHTLTCPKQTSGSNLHSQASIERGAGMVVSQSDRPRVQPVRVSDLLRQPVFGGIEQADQQAEIMRSWDLKRANRDHGLQRLLHRLLCVKPDDIVVLLVVAGEQPNGCEIRRSLPEEKVRRLDLLRCRQERGPREAPAQPSSPERRRVDGRSRDRRQPRRSELEDPAVRVATARPRRRNLRPPARSRARRSRNRRRLPPGPSTQRGSPANPAEPRARCVRGSLR